MPDEVIDVMCNCDHQLRHWGVMRELLMHNVNCVFNDQFSQSFRMKYRHPDGSLILCNTIDRIEVSAFHLLQRIRDSKPLMEYLKPCYANQLDEITWQIR